MKRFNLAKLIILVFAISWLGVLPDLLSAHGVQIPAFLTHFSILMTLGPLLVAVGYILLTQGRRALWNFFGRLLQIRTGGLVIFVAIVLPIVISGLSSWSGLMISGTEWPNRYSGVKILTDGISITLMYLLINTEELVWRGIVFDRLIRRNGFINSCLILAPIWWLFHIPLFLFPGGHQAGYGIGEFTFIVIAETVLLGWIYVKSNSSLFYVHAHHQLMNGFGQAFPIFPVFIAGNRWPIWMFCILLVICAVIIVYYNKPQNDTSKQ